MPQDNGRTGSWMSRLGDGRVDRYRHHATEGKFSDCISRRRIVIRVLLCDILNLDLLVVPTFLGIKVSLSSSTALRSVRQNSLLFLFLKPYSCASWIRFLVSLIALHGTHDGDTCKLAPAVPHPSQVADLQQHWRSL